MTPSELVGLSAAIAMVLLIVALLMTTIRVIAGPSLADRVLGLDMLVTIAIGFIAVFAIRAGQYLYIDIALALGLVGFLATIAFARYIVRQEGQGGDGPAAWPTDKGADQKPGRPEVKKPAAGESARPAKTRGRRR